MRETQLKAEEIRVYDWGRVPGLRDLLTAGSFPLQFVSPPIIKQRQGSPILEMLCGHCHVVCLLAINNIERRKMA